MEVLEITQSLVKPTVITRVWHRLQERLRNPDLRRHAARLIALARPAPSSTRAASERAPAAVELQRDGVTMLPGLIGGQEIAELREALSAFPCFDPWKNADSVEFPHDQIPPGTHVAQIREAPRLQRLHEIALDSRIIGLVENYFGCRPYLDSIQAWWSISGNNEAEEAENFHRDNDSIRFLKLFLYATDVGPDNGPHVYVAGSHAEPLLTQRRRLSDAEVEQAFGRDRIRTMTGVAGDAFLEDTYGIHKGQLPVAGKRLLIQFRYSITETVFRSPLMVSSPLNAKATAATSLIHER